MSKKRSKRIRDPHAEREAQNYENPIASRELILETLAEAGEPMTWQQVAEVLIATSSTVPGEATASYLSRRLQEVPVRLTRLACGIPMGMDIKYADEMTLSRAIETRSERGEPLC